MEKERHLLATITTHNTLNTSTYTPCCLRRTHVPPEGGGVVLRVTCQGSLAGMSKELASMVTLEDECRVVDGNHMCSSTMRSLIDFAHMPHTHVHTFCSCGKSCLSPWTQYGDCGQLRIGHMVDPACLHVHNMVTVANWGSVIW